MIVYIKHMALTLRSLRGVSAFVFLGPAAYGQTQTQTECIVALTRYLTVGVQPEKIQKFHTYLRYERTYSAAWRVKAPSPYFLNTGNSHAYSGKWVDFMPLTKIICP